MARNKKNNKQSTKGGQTKKKASSSSSMSSIVAQVVKQAAPLLIKGALTAASGIPFPTSGARAIASPSPSSITQLSAPSANGAMVRTSKARMSNTSKGIRVCHREYIMDVVHSDVDDFELLEFEDVSPTNSSLFPWLTQIASRFETFRFEGLSFIYEPQTSTQSVGTVMLAIDYDANDSPPGDKTQLMSYKGAVRSPAWFAAVNRSDRSDLQKQKNYYTLGSPSQSSKEDLRLSSVGKFILAFQSEAAAYTAGELYVEYDIILETPQLQDNSQSAYLFQDDVVVPLGTTTVFPQNVTLSGNGSLPVNFVLVGGASMLAFGQAGTYEVTIYTNDAVAVPAGTGEANFAFVVPAGSQITMNQYGSQIYQQAAPHFESMMGTAFIRVPNPDELLEFGISVTGWTLTPWDTDVRIVINQMQDMFPIIPLPVPTSSSTSSKRALRLMGRRRATLLLEKPVPFLETTTVDLNSRKFLKTASDRVPVSCGCGCLTTRFTRCTECGKIRSKEIPRISSNS